ncbi:MAG: 2-C-methyl-D-erythritol 2,4-cyclodiphosphate synthase [Mogibacterium sp.]|nr:2-C-methyl-D-erythritol 2,4-cyclodiphosphate synthase [Mogibacterium sp.]
MVDNISNWICTVIVAAGQGTRMGTDVPKQLFPYGSSTVLGTAINAFASLDYIDKVYVVSPQDGSLDDTYEEITAECERLTGREPGSIAIVSGGSTRADSVREGIKAASRDARSAGIDEDDAIVLIHDAARPGISEEIIRRNIDNMRRCRAVCTALPSSDSTRMINIEKPEYVTELALKESITYPIMNTNVVRRELIYRTQTPQTFRLADILRAHERAVRDGYSATDDAMVAEYAGINVALVEGATANYKITTREDIQMTCRTGIGYDVHRLVPGRPLILCGTPIPSKLGLDGHSDADVAVHALMDALLGAAGLGDIGRHFPDTDEKYKGADSMKLLAEVKDMLGRVRIVNVDVAIIAQAPKLAPYMEQMKQNIASTHGIPETAVNVKATTEEGLGCTGMGEGMASMATAAIEVSF